MAPRVWAVQCGAGIGRARPTSHSMKPAVDCPRIAAARSRAALRESGMRIPIGKLFCELHIDRGGPVFAVDANLERQRIAFVEIIGIDAAAEHLGSVQENIGAAAVLLDEAE